MSDRDPRVDTNERHDRNRGFDGATCELCGLKYNLDDAGCPITNVPFTCDDCGGPVEPDTGVHR